MKAKMKTSEIVLVRDITINWGIIHWLFFFLASRRQKQFASNALIDVCLHKYMVKRNTLTETK